jgi:hypothetical protein
MLALEALTLLIKGLASLKPSRIGLEQHDFDALGRCLLAQSIRGGGAEGGVLEYHRDLGLTAYEFGHLQLRQGELRSA